MERNSFKTFRIVASVTAIVVVLAIIFYLIKTNSADKTNTEVTTTSQNNLKTYQNSTYNFTVMYPATYSEFHTSGDSDINFRSTTGCEIAPIGQIGRWPSDCQDYSISVQKNTPSIEGPGFVHSPIIVAGIQGEKVVGPTGFGNWEDIDQIVVWFKRGDNWYIQTFTFNHTKAQSAERVMNQILVSFQFIN